MPLPAPPNRFRDFGIILWTEHTCLVGADITPDPDYVWMCWMHGKCKISEVEYNPGMLLFLVLLLGL